MFGVALWRLFVWVLFMRATNEKETNKYGKERKGIGGQMEERRWREQGCVT